MNPRCQAKFLVGAIVVVFGATSRMDASIYSTTVLADNPTGYWRLGEASGSTAADSSGNGNHGTYLNGVDLGQPGAIANDPDTSAGFVKADRTIIDTSLELDASSYTLEAWIKPTDTTSPPQADVIIGESSGRGQLVYNWNQPGLVAINFWTGSSFTHVASTAPVPLMEWTHVAGTWNELTKDLKLYVNGELDNSTNLPGVSPVDASTTLPIQIGGFNDTPFRTQFFNGGIDEVAYYPVELSAQQIDAHFNAAAIPEPSTMTIYLGLAICCCARFYRMRRAPLLARPAVRSTRT
jgi:hypothetical protein